MWAPNDRDRRILSELHPDLREKALQVLRHVNVVGKLAPGVWLRPHTGFRSPEAQLAAFRAGNTTLKRGKHNVTPARAVDLVFTVNGAWSWDTRLSWWYIGFWGELVGLTWGGRWGTPQAARKVPAHAKMRYGWDLPHLELKTWK